MVVDLEGIADKTREVLIRIKVLDMLFTGLKLCGREEGDTREIYYTAMSDILDKLMVLATDLLNEEGTAIGKGDELGMKLDKDEIHLISILRQLNDAGRDCIFKLIDSMPYSPEMFMKAPQAARGEILKFNAHKKGTGEEIR